MPTPPPKPKKQKPKPPPVRNQPHPQAAVPSPAVGAQAPACSSPASKPRPVGGISVMLPLRSGSPPQSGSYAALPPRSQSPPTTKTPWGSPPTKPAPRPSFAPSPPLLSLSSPDLPKSVSPVAPLRPQPVRRKVVRPLTMAPQKPLSPVPPAPRKQPPISPLTATPLSPAQEHPESPIHKKKPPPPAPKHIAPAPLESANPISPHEEKAASPAVPSASAPTKPLPSPVAVVSTTLPETAQQALPRPDPSLPSPAEDSAPSSTLPAATQPHPTSPSSPLPQPLTPSPATAPPDKPVPPTPPPLKPSTLHVVTHSANPSSLTPTPPPTVAPDSLVSSTLPPAKPSTPHTVPTPPVTRACQIVSSPQILPQTVRADSSPQLQLKRQLPQQAEFCPANLTTMPAPSSAIEAPVSVAPAATSSDADSGSDKDKESASKEQATPEELEKVQKHRDSVAKEILTTERTYVEQLAVCVEVFLQPLRTKPDLLTSEQVGIIFSNVESVLMTNKQLLSDLEQRMQEWGPTQLLGDLFVKMVPFLRMYRVYTTNYEQSISMLQQLTERNPLFAAFLDDKKANDPRCKLAPLNSFLIVPVQRIPRYKLLLEDLLKHTFPEHPDHKYLEEALGTIKTVAREINEEIKAQEARQKMLELQQRVGHMPGIKLVVPHRHFVREGILYKVCRKYNLKRQVFLFNDLLIYGNTLPGGFFRFHRAITLDSVNVRDEADTGLVKNGFSIGSAQKSFIMFAETHEEKVNWLLDIIKCLNEFRSHRKSFAVVLKQGDLEEANFQAPLWQVDHQVAACNLCRGEFSLITRRHHCRLCGLVVCGQCSLKKIPIPSSMGLQRVCDNCFAQYQQKQQPSAEPSSACAAAADKKLEQPQIPATAALKRTGSSHLLPPTPPAAAPSPATLRRQAVKEEPKESPEQISSELSPDQISLEQPQATAKPQTPQLPTHPLPQVPPPQAKPQETSQPAEPQLPPHTQQQEPVKQVEPKPEPPHHPKPLPHPEKDEQPRLMVQLRHVTRQAPPPQKVEEQQAEQKRTEPSPKPKEVLEEPPAGKLSEQQRAPPPSPPPQTLQIAKQVEPRPSFQAKPLPQAEPEQQPRFMVQLRHVAVPKDSAAPAPVQQPPAQSHVQALAAAPAPVRQPQAQSPVQALAQPQPAASLRPQQHKPLKASAGATAVGADSPAQRRLPPQPKRAQPRQLPTPTHGDSPKQPPRGVALVAQQTATPTATSSAASPQ
eukprot:TRINITY_DN1003_c0_g2_i1.p1 TRINITY_DN1003_c0_g2~~TRINITY_DN1003_c0_g2_i1.p1  ORF type:complete len:1350 (+),score=306.79 TRINITY_DN1003_c0_g2_i1:364-4050(+)